ncbi:MAG: glycosyltransferase [Clostridia bacterium]|nr:glycosyltransferase [Clostridia bacterium]
MRIVVNDIAASKGGAMAVLRDFYNCVKENDKENEWIFLLGDKYFDETENVRIVALPEIKKSSLKRLAFDFLTGKSFISKLNPDVVFSMQNTITYGVKVPQVVYMHQSIPFQDVKKFSFVKSSERKIAVVQYFLGALIRASVRRATKTIVQTEWIRDAVIKKCKVAPERVVNVLPPMKDVSAYANIACFDKTKFFYPTADMIYKNNGVIFEASEKLQKEGISHNVCLTLPPEKSRGAVNCIGRIEFEEVLKKYSESTLVFPSYIETFGYPLAEARAIGTVILASDCAFSREVLDGYENAYFFNPFKPEELALLMKKVADGEILPQSTDKKLVSLSNSWEKVLHEVVAVSKQ